mmetsp:Transcript_27829/g.33985  ORF Transcript_27829/g.33985 Transcript_27829/m.33985 type:complete len:98 (-) Transcript_27829:83-376(-)
MLLIKDVGIVLGRPLGVILGFDLGIEFGTMIGVELDIRVGRADGVHLSGGDTFDCRKRTLVRLPNGMYSTTNGFKIISLDDIQFKLASYGYYELMTL